MVPIYHDPRLAYYRYDQSCRYLVKTALNHWRKTMGMAYVELNETQTAATGPTYVEMNVNGSYYSVIPPAWNKPVNREERRHGRPNKKNRRYYQRCKY